MVTEQARWVLVNTKVDPLLVAEVWGITENECWDYLTEVNRNLNEMEEKYGTQEQRSLAQEWANSLPEAFETKRQLLLERLQKANSEEEKRERLINYKLFTNKIKSLPISLYSNFSTQLP